MDSYLVDYCLMEVGLLRRCRESHMHAENLMEGGLLSDGFLPGGFLTDEDGAVCGGVVRVSTTCVRCAGVCRSVCCVSATCLVCEGCVACGVLAPLVSHGV